MLTRIPFEMRRASRRANEKPIVFTNIADRATDEAFNIQVRQFINFLGERIQADIHSTPPSVPIAWIRWSALRRRGETGG